MTTINRPSGNLSTYRIQKGIIRLENWGFALKFTFSSKEVKEEFVKMTYCQMFFYPMNVELPPLKSTPLFHSQEVLCEYRGTIKENEVYISIPRPGKYFVSEVAYHFFDSHGNVICSHNQTI